MLTAAGAGVRRRSHAPVPPAHRRAARAPRRGAAALQRGRPPGFSRRHRRRPSRRLEGRLDSSRPAGPARRDHRPGRSQDDHQRAELGRIGVHGRLRGRHLADLGQPRRRPGQPHRRRPPHDLLREPRDRQALRAQSADRDADGPARAGSTCPSATSSSTAARLPACCSTSACTSSTTPRRWPEAGTGPYFYLPKMQSHLEARLWNDVFVHAQRR